MVDGCYKVVMKAPMGLKHGFLTIQCEAGQVSGIFRILQHDNPIRDGVVNGNTFSISGLMVSPVRTTLYSMEGTVTGDTLEATVTVEFGNMPLSGSRLESGNFVKG